MFRWIFDGKPVKQVSIHDLDDYESMVRAISLSQGSVLVKGEKVKPAEISEINGIRNGTGTIPGSLHLLENLMCLNLCFNQFTGTLAGVTKLHNLRILELGHNYLTGSIPVELCSLVNLVTLYYYAEIRDLRHNLLSGEIPKEIGNLVNLKRLILDVNRISGNIPNSIGNLLELQELSISFTALEGSIPATIGDLIKLDTLYSHD
jgi:Leucine-rich repeat (LRR) protein